MLLTLVLSSLMFLPSPLMAYESVRQDQPSHKTPKELEGIGIDEKLGQMVNLTTEFTREDGQKVKLADYYKGNLPVLLTMVYFNCPSLCNYHLNGLLDTFKKMDLAAGRDFSVVAVSMDHKETHDLAKKKKESYLKEFGRPEGNDGWHFLVGTEENVLALAASVGFKFKWVEEDKMYAHAAAAYVTTPKGIISRYLYGIEFAPKTVGLSMIEASEGKVGSVIDQIILFCYQFDPKANKYTLYAYNIMRIGALLAVILLAAFLGPMWLKEKQREAQL